MEVEKLIFIIIGVSLHTVHRYMYGTWVGVCGSNTPLSPTSRIVYVSKTPKNQWKNMEKRA
jgi:hypothetical protein